MMKLYKVYTNSEGKTRYLSSKLEISLYILYLVLAICLFTGCRAQLSLKTTYNLVFTGDIADYDNIENKLDALELKTIDYNKNKVAAVDTVSLIEAYKPIYVENELHIIADDGFMVTLDASTLKDTYICYSDTDGWCFVSSKHPVNSRVKHIKECILVAKNPTALENDALGFYIATENQNYFYSYGQLRMNMNEIITTTDGITSLDGVSIEVRKQKKCVSLDQLVDENINNIMIITHEGELINEYSRFGYLEYINGKVNYIGQDLKNTYSNLAGIYINPVGDCITDLYSDAQYYLDKGVNVLALYIDGFSYGQYEYLKANYPEMFLANIENVRKAHTVYKPVTNAGFAAMLSGVNPDKNGVKDRDNRKLEVSTIFDYCNGKSLKNQLVEGDIAILDIETELILNLDTNENGFVDDEIFETAYKKLNQNNKFIMVHFHSVDDYGHDFGPLSSETINQLKVIDTYVKALVTSFDGKIIILSDHGMHKTADGGSHGQIRYEDMNVPYMIVEGE